MTPDRDKELDRQWERWKLFLARWQNEVVAHERLGWEAQKIASDFGKLGLSSSLLLNGGALVALPPMMQWLNSSGRALVPSVAVWFPMGILAAVLAILVAYLNFMGGKAEQYAYAKKRGRELDQQYINKPVADDKDHKDALRAVSRARIFLTFTQVLSIVLGLLSYLFFAIGVFGFLTLAQYNVAR